MAFSDIGGRGGRRGACLAGRGYESCCRGLGGHLGARAERLSELGLGFALISGVSQASGSLSSSAMAGHPPPLPAKEGTEAGRILLPRAELGVQGLMAPLTLGLPVTRP